MVMSRQRLARLERTFATTAPRILGVTVDARTEELRSIVKADGVMREAPQGLTRADLSPDCLVCRYDPSRECPSLFVSTEDDRARVKRVFASEEGMFGHNPVGAS
jgi:hypothetical protein